MCSDQRNPAEHPLTQHLLSRLCLILILLMYFSIVLGSSRRLSATYDETLHVGSGLTMLTREAYVDYPRAWWTKLDLLHPIADILPGLAARADGQSPDYRRSMFTDFRHLQAARTVNHFAGALILIMVFLWAEQLWGTLGGLIAAGLLAFYPLFLTHATIVSSDLFMALGALVAIRTIWDQFLRRPGNLAGWGWPLWRAALAAALAICFAVFCKLNNIIFLPLAALAMLWAAWAARGPSRIAALARALAAAALCALVTLALVATAYQVTHRASAPLVLHPPLLGGRPLSISLPFGQPLLLALNTARTINRVQTQVYFNGRLTPPHGWYYAVSFFLKTPLPLLFLLPLIFYAVLADARRHRDSHAAAYLIGLLVALTLLFTSRGFFIGLRVLLTSIILLAVLAGALGRLGSLVRRGPAIGLYLFVVLGLAGSAADVLRVVPWQISYFNPLGRHRMVFVDSEADWGQGLIALRQWQDRFSPDEPIWLAYFGNNEPADYGIHYRGLLSAYTPLQVDPEGRQHHDPSDLTGYVAISKTQLAGTYMPAIGESADYFAPWRKLKPDFEVGGGSILIYDLRRPEPRDRRPPRPERDQPRYVMRLP